MNVTHAATAALIALAVLASAIAALAKPMPPLPPHPQTGGKSYLARLLCPGGGIGQDTRRGLVLTTANAASHWRLEPLGSGYYRFRQYAPTDGVLTFTWRTDGASVAVLTSPLATQHQGAWGSQYESAWYVGAIANGPRTMRLLDGGQYLTCPTNVGDPVLGQPAYSNAALITFDVGAQVPTDEPTRALPGVDEAKEACRDNCVGRSIECQRVNGFACKTIYKACLRRCG